MDRVTMICQACRLSALLISINLFFLGNIRAQSTTSTIVDVDARQLMQRIDGVGVNVNTRSWDDDKLIPALELLHDSLNATIWRVILETVDDWEVKNDNADPFIFNWTYYNRLYETPKFKKAWAMIAYLNKRGIAGNLMINFMGFAPAWMGNKIIETKYEDEYVEMITSFYYYAIRKKQLRFAFIAPTNESDHHNYSEGPHLSGEQHARILHKLIRRMQLLGIMDGISIVAPDNASTPKALAEFVPAMLRDSLVMSHIKNLGFHTYSGDAEGVQQYINNSAYPNKSFWVTEWNAWCDGCDDGKLGEYNYEFAAKSVSHLIRLLNSGASACLVWEGYDSYYSHHAPSLFSYWGVLGYNQKNKTYHPRKHFYAIQQLSRFVGPGYRRIEVSQAGDSMPMFSALDSSRTRWMLAGINNQDKPSVIKLMLNDIKAANIRAFFTNAQHNLQSITSIKNINDTIEIEVPAQCIFTLTAQVEMSAKKDVMQKPEPAGWYAGDIHVHRNCGTDSILPESSLPAMMDENDLAVVSILADMGNGEVRPSKEDLAKITGLHSPLSTSSRILQWDTEWHWDATYNQFGHQALGGHLILLGLMHAEQIWEESPWRVLAWARKQNAVKGFAHFQYLADSVQTELNCCIPMDYPVEAALGNIDFISEDVYSSTMREAGSFSSEAAMNAYYRLLNCGFKIGLAAGTDYPCNGNEPLGSLLTYVKVDGELTYRKWIEGIKYGRSVVSRNAHREFIDLKVSGKYEPGSVVRLHAPGSVEIQADWTSLYAAGGTLELLHNGKVISRLELDGKQRKATVNTSVVFGKSGWIAARHMDKNMHQVHTAPVYVLLKNNPIRASRKDAEFFIAWIDNLLGRIKPGGEWNHYFTKDLKIITERYQRARKIYVGILNESTSD